MNIYDFADVKTGQLLIEDGRNEKTININKIVKLQRKNKFLSCMLKYIEITTPYLSEEELKELKFEDKNKLKLFTLKFDLLTPVHNKTEWFCLHFSKCPVDYGVPDFWDERSYITLNLEGSRRAYKWEYQGKNKKAEEDYDKETELEVIKPLDSFFSDYADISICSSLTTDGEGYDYYSDDKYNSACRLEELQIIENNSSSSSSSSMSSTSGVGFKRSSDMQYFDPKLNKWIDIETCMKCNKQIR